jgi:DNA-directed RNA polymerase specialized sigma24 family protein
VNLALVESVTVGPVRVPYSAASHRPMNASDFNRLLARLHADSGQAAHEYERLRRALIKFFDWRGAPAPDQCADEVFDRLAQKVEDTAVRDVTKYAYGVARLVALEQRRVPAFTSLDEAPQAALVSAAPVDDGDPVRDCFDRCLAELPEESRSLLLRYYEGQQSAKISNRRRLASLFGLTDNALRSRVQRLRDRLEQCVNSCASQPLSQTL